MFGQSFIIKKIAQSAVQGICEAFDMDEDDARDVAKGVAIIGGVGAAIVTLDFLGGASVVAEEVIEEIAEEEIMENATAACIAGDATLQFGGYGEHTIAPNWTTINGDAVFNREFIDGVDQFGNPVSAIQDQSVSYGMLDFED